MALFRGWGICRFGLFLWGYVAGNFFVQLNLGFHVYAGIEMSDGIWRVCEDDFRVD